MARHKLTAEQKDTLLRIYAAAMHTAGPIRYLAKQLAPNILTKNASRYFDQLEGAGWIVRYLSEETGRVFGVELSPRGLAVAKARRAEMLPLVEEPPTEDSPPRKPFLPELLPR